MKHTDLLIDLAGQKMDEACRRKIYTQSRSQERYRCEEMLVDFPLIG